MLSVALSFLYIGLTTFLLGFSVRLGVKKFFGYQIQEVSGLFYAGLAVATVYAGLYSLFSGVGLGANIGLVLAGAVIAVSGRKELGKYLSELKRQMTFGKCLFFLILFLLFSYGTSRGYLHVDSGLYHAQAIRWIEEYGVVKGLANLHCRLAYNSSAFVLTALYSMSFLIGQSLHTAAGFMALVLAGKAFSVVEVFKRKRVLVSDFVKVALLFYLSMIYTEMMSPASDYFAMLFLFYIVLKWVELEEARETEITPFGMLCVLLAVTVTIKLSAVIMLVLVIKPAVVLLKEKRYAQIGMYLFLGILAVAPYLLRNMILSGWLVYPFPAIDLFSFDWKIPKGEALYDAEEIKVYAKGMTDVLLKDTPMREWLSAWFTGLKGLEKIWVLGSVVSVAAGVVAIVVSVWEKKKEDLNLGFMEAVLIAGYLFWQLGTPLVRYGYIYILAFPFFTAGLYFVRIFGKNKNSYLVFGALLVAFFAYKGVNLVGDIRNYSEKEYYVWQQDYYTGPYESYEIEGVEFYVPLEYGQIGYEMFPSAPTKRFDVEFRGETLREGFRRK